MSAIACERTGQSTNNTNINATAENDSVISLSYRDGGAVVPNPVIRSVQFTIQDSTKGTLTAVEFNGADSIYTKVDLDVEQIDFAKENILKLADIPDGMEIKLGKKPCVGQRGIDVYLTLNNSDTTSFRINGGALCDPDVVPEWKALDSMVRVLNNRK
jgi:hypothetical protein